MSGKDALDVRKGISPTTHELDGKCVALLKAARAQAGLCSNLPFEKLLLNFPQLEDGLTRIENAFTARSLDAERPSEQAEKARDLLGIRGAKDSLEEFLPAKRDDSGVVHLIDFVVGIAMLLIQLGLSEVKAGSADPQTVETLKLAIASFNHFDKDGNGSLMQEEVTGTMGEVDNSAHAKRISSPHQGGISERWKLMDLDKDGRATFRDYVYSLYRWVMDAAGE